MTLPPVPQNKNNLPVYTILMATVLLIVAVCALVFIPARNETQSTLLVGMIITAIPGLIASGFGERNHRDIRNGVVESKVKAGTLSALQESGVQDVVDASGKGSASVLVMQALSKLLEANTAVHITHETTDVNPSATPGGAAIVGTTNPT